MFAPQTFALANETDEQTEVFGLENEFSLGADGWIKLSPYGDHLKERLFQQPGGGIREQRFFQRLDRPAAEAMVRQFNSPLGRLKRFVVGVPIFKRHPDIPIHAPGTVTALANDKQAYGYFAELQAREDGLYAKPVLSDEGVTAIENEGLKYISPFWLVRPNGETDGVKVVSPFKLLSGGLTDRPNIKGADALANQKEIQPQPPTEEMDKKILIALLALANEANETDIVKAITQMKAKADRHDALENEKTGAATALANEQSAHKQLQAAFQAERQARTKLLIDQAIADGRITEAERPNWTTALANEKEFDAQVTALANEKPKIKTKATTTASLGTRQNERAIQENLNDQVMALANEEYDKNGGDWDRAWRTVEAKHPALFEQMKKPAHQQQ